MTRLAGKTALITGAARGIGTAFAEAYIREGARVAIADINISRARQTATELGKDTLAIEMDVSRNDSIAMAVNEAVDGLGQIDILINNAALFTAAPIVEIDPEDFYRVFNINVAGTLFTMQAVARHMIERGIRGRIINMACLLYTSPEPTRLMATSRMPSSA
jgi:D-sorbitol dehydrogenase (acceptor)